MRELVRHVAAAQAEDEAAIREAVEIGGGARQDDRVPVRGAGDEGAEADRARGGGERRQGGPGGVAEDGRVVGQPERVEAEPLDRLDEVAGGAPIRQRDSLHPEPDAAGSFGDPRMNG